MKRFRKMLTVSVMMMTILAFTVVVSPVSAASDGDLIKMDGLSSVYYLKGGKRYVFPNEQTYFSWYSDWSGVKTVSASELQSYPLAANVVTRPGTDLVKITTDPTVYAVEPGGVLRSIVSEANAIALWGANWADMVRDVADSFFVNYTVGAPLTAGVYPVGTLVNPTGTMDIFYFDGTNYRKFNDEAAFLANKFQFENIVTTDKTITAGGAGIAAVETALTNVANTGAASTVTTPIGGSGLSVALASNTAAASTLIGGQAIANLASFNLSAAADGDVTVTTLKAKRIGVSADTTLTAVYLYDGVNRLTDSATVSSGVITWNNSAGIIKIPAGTTKTLTIKSNIASATGETVGVAINAAADITAGGATISGSFPVNGNIHSIASASLATVQFNAGADGVGTLPATNTDLDPQNDYVLWNNNVQVGTRAAYLHYITLRNIGSITASDITNFEFFVKGVKVGNTVANMDANGYVTFDLTASPLKMETGANDMKVVADIVGGSSRTVQMSLRQPSDVMVVDADYNANILVTGNATLASGVFSARSAGVQTIGTGNLTITKKTDSPSGNVVVNGSQVALGTFEIKAYGEAVKLETLDVAIHASTVTDEDAGVEVNLAYTLRNGALFANGVQVGSTTAIAEDSDTTQAYTRFNLGSSLVVTPGTPVVLTVRADVYDSDGTNDAASGETLRVDIVAGDNNAQRMTSLNYFSTLAQSANTLTIADGSLALTKNQAYGSQTVVVPASAQKMGDFTLTTGSTDAINLTSLAVTFTTGNDFAAADDLSDVYVVYGTDTTNIKSAVVSDAANTWTINKTMAANTNMNIAVYANVASTAKNDADADTIVTSLKVTGNTSVSGTSVNTGATAVDGQTITASAGGSLTVQLADDTPAAHIAVAGTQPNDGSIKLKLTSASEDIYVKTIKFRSDITTDDVAISSVDLYAGTGSTFSKVSVTKTWDADSTNPGYVNWTLTGTDRIMVPKDGTVYVIAKPTYVESDQGAASGKTPALFLADLEAEGSATLTPSGTALTNDAGVIIKSGASATYVDSTDNKTAAAITATATTVPTAPVVAFLPGDIIFIDADAGGDWDAATEELMVVLIDGGANLTVERGAFGTTAVAYDDQADNIYRLRTATMTTTAGIVGSATTLANTKPTIALYDSVSATAGTQQVIYKFTVTADSNTADPAENYVALTNLVLTTNKSGLTVKNLKVYPEAFDQNTDYDVVATGLTTSTWNLVMSDLPANLNRIPEGSSRNFIVRADVGSTTTATNTLTTSIASLSSGGSVTWADDAGNSLTWVDQTGASYIDKQLTYGASAGTYDNVAPTITGILVTNVLTANSLAAGDTIKLTFSEMIDPTSVNASLTAGGSAVTGVLATATGGVTGEADDGVITVTGITTFDSGATLAADASFTTNLALNTAGTELTITLNTGTARVVGTPALGAGTQVAAIVDDINGVASAAVATAVPTGDTF